MRLFIIIIYISIFLLSYAVPLLAGPFGLDMGMTLQQVKKVSSIKPSKGSFIYYSAKLPKNHISFEKYVLYITPKNGLCKISAIGKDVTTSVYGNQLISEYEQIEKTLTSKYGKSDHKFDYLNNGSIWNNDNEWTMALKLKERMLQTPWAGISTSLPDSLKSVVLEAFASDANTGYFTVDYEFENYSDCVREARKVEQDSL